MSRDMSMSVVASTWDRHEHRRCAGRDAVELKMLPQSFHDSDVEARGDACTRFCEARPGCQAVVVLRDARVRGAMHNATLTCELSLTNIIWSAKCLSGTPA